MKKAIFDLPSTHLLANFGYLYLHTTSYLVHTRLTTTLSALCSEKTQKTCANDMYLQCT